MTGVRTPRASPLRATVTVATTLQEVKVIEHVHLALAQGGPLLECVPKDPDNPTAAVVTRWSPEQPPISTARLRPIMFRSLQSARQKAPTSNTDAALEIQNQKIPLPLEKPIS